MNRGMRKIQLERIYVKVNSDFDATGYMQPRAITWDDGRVFKIDRVKDFRPDDSETHRSCDCYTVIIRGEEKLLFFERTDSRFANRIGRWFIKKPVAQ